MVCMSVSLQNTSVERNPEEDGGGALGNRECSQRLKCLSTSSPAGRTVWEAMESLGSRLLVKEVVAVGRGRGNLRC